MSTIKSFVLGAAAALVVTACTGKPQADNAIASSPAEATTPAAPTKDAIVALETSAYEAWKSKDAKFWDAFLSDRFVGYGAAGRLDKASATKEFTGADCEIKSYALSEEQMRLLGDDAVLLTHKITVDGTCGGQEAPAESWAAGVYVRDGNQWKCAFHGESAIVDPAAAPAKPVEAKAPPLVSDDKPANGDAGTNAMLAVEKVVWEAWKDHDGKKLGELTAADISFINIFGTYLGTKADALKNWSGVGCDVKSVSVTDAAGTMLSPSLGILQFNGGAVGTCFGQKVGPIWGTSVYVKEGDAWKWTFGINVPAG
jgi:hypothetical protein